MPLPPVGAVAGPAAPSPVSSTRASFGAVLSARVPARAPPAAPAGVPGRAAQVLEGIERAQRRLDSVLAAARAGRTFTAQELLGLQAEAYRAVQTVDLATKIVEQGSQTVKQALNAQV
jgi:hypothetical protein